MKKRQASIGNNASIHTHKPDKLGNVASEYKRNEET